MFDNDPEDRSSAPPAHPRPLTIPFAVLWFLFATAVAVLLIGVTQALRPGAVGDLVNGVVCQAAAYVLTLLLIVRVHGGQRSAGGVLALRATHPGFYLVGLALGLLLQVPAELLQRAIDSVWPLDPSMLDAQGEMMRMDGLLQKIMIPFVVIVVGPVVEEMLFRGALQGGLRRVYPQAIVVPVVAALFAGAHGTIQLFLPLLVVGAVVTALRAASGSIIPALLTHMAFNAVPIVGLMLGVISLTPDPEPLPLSVSAVGVGGSLVLVAIMVWLARRSAWAHQARLEDLA